MSNGSKRLKTSAGLNVILIYSAASARKYLMRDKFSLQATIGEGLPTYTLPPASTLSESPSLAEFEAIFEASR